MVRGGGCDDAENRHASRVPGTRFDHWRGAVVWPLTGGSGRRCDCGRAAPVGTSRATRHRTRGIAADPEDSLYWFAYGANKRSVTLDLQTDVGRDGFRRLVGTADVVLESFPPDYIARPRIGL